MLAAAPVATGSVPTEAGHTGRLLAPAVPSTRGGTMTASTDVGTRDGVLVVELTKSSFEALERECRHEIDCAIGDLGMGEDDRMRKRLNASADVLCAIERAKSGWGLEDPREEATVKAVEFTAAAVAFLREQRDAVAARMGELDTSGEANFESHAHEAFLHHVLDRVLTEGVAA